jgi:hypothetical protein
MRSGSIGAVKTRRVWIRLLKSLAKPGALFWVATEAGFRVIYVQRARAVTFVEIGNERYVTLRALNENLAGDYEIRVLRNSLGYDTNGFVIAPVALWNDLKAKHASRLAKRFKVIQPEDGCHNQ